ncbi:unnamed protein product [Closterium sp. Naga37s-1]|nr:unnamed protein product [Closterium sp. Naga37s-1]
MHKSFCHTSLSLHIPVLTPPFPPTAICASRHNTHPSLSPFPLSLSSLPFTLSPSLSPLPSLPFLSPLHPLPFPLSPSLSPFPLSPSPSPFPSLPFLSLLPSLHHPYPLLLSPFPLFYHLSLPSHLNCPFSHPWSLPSSRHLSLCSSYKQD